jgi:hypothetical protein
VNLTIIQASVNREAGEKYINSGRGKPVESFLPARGSHDPQAAGRDSVH